MKTKTIYILRHGQTDLNKQGMVQGRGVDASLNDTGQAQAAKVYHHLKEVPFDIVYTSALIRTQQTVSHFLENGLVTRALAGLDEISWGNQEGVKADLEARNLYASTVEGWRNGDLHLNVGGGESPLDVVARQKEAMEEVMAFEGNNLLICMHGRAMRILLCWLLNYPLNYMDGFPHDNCAYYKLIHRGEDFIVEEFNARKHLNDS